MRPMNTYDLLANGFSKFGVINLMLIIKIGNIRIS
jgi:hypothetical protein